MSGSRTKAVEELEALALEYRQSTSLQRRSEIRAVLWRTEQQFAYRTVLLRRIQASGIPERAYAQGQDMLDEKVFHEKGFNKIVHGWDPEGGKSFTNYFRRAIVLRCGDVIRKLRKSRPCPGKTVDADGATDPSATGREENPSRHGRAGLLDTLKALDSLVQGVREVREVVVEESKPLIGHESTDEDTSERPGPLLSEALAEIEQEKGRGNADLGREARAVFELIHRAYIDVEDMGKFTLAKAADVLGSDAHNKLTEAYQDDQSLFTRLGNSLAAALAVAERYECDKQRLADALQGMGYSFAAILSLDDAARRSVRDKSPPGTVTQDGIGKETSVVAERYAAVCAKARRLRHIRQVLCEAYAKYASVATNSPWTRSESEIAGLMHMSQPNVHRRLEFARRFLYERGDRE